MPRASCHSAPRRPAAAPRPPGRAGHAVAAAFRARRRVIFSKIRIVRASESDRGHGTVRVRVGCTDMLTDQAACGSTITAGFPRPLAAPPTTRSLTEAVARLGLDARGCRVTVLPAQAAAAATAGAAAADAARLTRCPSHAPGTPGLSLSDSPADSPGFPAGLSHCAVGLVPVPRLGTHWH